MMTQPTVIFFGPDGSRFDSSKNKIYLRTLLYSTDKKKETYLRAYMYPYKGMNQNKILVYGDMVKEEALI